MLRACVLDFGGSCEDHLPLKFVYKNSYQSNIKMASFEALYDRRRQPLSFEVGDHVFLRVSPRKRLLRFGRSGKLSPYFIGLFEILDHVGEVAYRLAVQPQMDRVHNVFPVSMLRKYELDPSHMSSWVDVNIDEDISYEEGPIQILDTRDKVLRGKTVPLVKVLWQHHGAKEATWEGEQDVRYAYLSLFSFLGMT
ncbi:uncharacterized protein LOC132314023 [Cornus florida]|uniref:uncharacterized protein LOC132314023 n=1 Tax=Cornus florida TaxID=4283 RepID=UPI00289BAF7C|nr:uncharacterized protein LOC132314023 [Cornus florida]